MGFILLGIVIIVLVFCAGGIITARFINKLEKNEEKIPSRFDYMFATFKGFLIGTALVVAGVYGLLYLSLIVQL